MYNSKLKKCQNGKCTNAEGGFDCVCDDFFDGVNCELELDACVTREDPC